MHIAIVNLDKAISQFVDIGTRRERINGQSSFNCRVEKRELGFQRANPKLVEHLVECCTRHNLTNVRFDSNSGDISFTLDLNTVMRDYQNCQVALEVAR